MGTSRSGLRRPPAAPATPPGLPAHARERRRRDPGHRPGAGVAAERGRLGAELVAQCAGSFRGLRAGADNSEAACRSPTPACRGTRARAWRPAAGSWGRESADRTPSPRSGGRAPTLCRSMLCRADAAARELSGSAGRVYKRGRGELKLPQPGLTLKPSPAATEQLVQAVQTPTCLLRASTQPHPGGPSSERSLSGLELSLYPGEHSAVRRIRRDRLLLATDMKSGVPRAAVACNPGSSIPRLRPTT